MEMMKLGARVDAIGQNMRLQTEPLDYTYLSQFLRS
jgi:hypothetical protein